MKLLIIVLISILLFACAKDSSINNDRQRDAKVICNDFNRGYSEYLKSNNLSELYSEHLNWFNSNNYCETKYPLPLFASENILLCMKYTMDIETLKEWVKTEIEEQSPLCKQAFAKNDRTACISLNEFFIDELKLKCSDDSELLNLIEQHTVFYTTNCNNLYTEEERYELGFNSECPRLIQEMNCSEIKTIIGTDLKEFSVFCNSLTEK